MTPTASPFDTLSPCERADLRAVGEGQLAKQIAAARGVSERTVETELKRARIKLDASNTTHAAVMLAVHETGKSVSGKARTTEVFHPAHEQAQHVGKPAPCTRRAAPTSPRKPRRKSRRRSAPKRRKRRKRR